MTVPRNSIGPSSGPTGRAPLKVVRWDPGAERAGAIAQSFSWLLASTLAVSVGLAATSTVGTALGWGLLGAALALSTSPFVAHLLGQRRRRTLPIWDLLPRWARVVARSAEEADRLRELAERAPDGPVAEHLLLLAARAEDYVVALHGAGRRAGTASSPTGGFLAPSYDQSNDRELEAEAALILERLTELTESAERLRRAQRRHLESSPLDDLIERTDRLTDVIESQAERHARR